MKILKSKQRVPSMLGACVSTFAAFFCGNIQAQIQQAWVARYNGGITNGQHEALKMQVGTDGNIYVCGFSQNTNSNLGYAVWKYAPSGKLLWVSRLDSTNVAQAKPSAFSLDANNNSVVTGNAMTVRIDSNGNQLWEAPYAGFTVATDHSGNAYVGGYSQDFGIVKISPQGSNLWTASYVDAGGPTVSQAVVVDGLDNVYVSGLDSYFNPSTGPPGPYVYLTTIKYNSAGSRVWTNSWAPTPQNTSVLVHGSVSGPGGSVYLIAEFFSGNRTPAAPYLSLQLDDGSGKTVWFAGDPTGAAYSISGSLALDPANNLLVTGMNAYSFPNSSYGTYKIGTNGTYLWGAIYPVNPAGVSVGTSITTDSRGEAYVTGYSPGANISNDIVTIAYDTNGKQLWLQRYDGPAHGDDQGNAIAVDNNGNVYVAGYDTPVGGGTEMVLIKYSPVTAKHEANGSFQLQAQGAANEPFDIRASTNLESWQDLGAFDADTNGLLQFVDTNASQYGSRFYLAIPQ